MCRLSLNTDRRMSRPARHNMMHTLMLHAIAEDQNDGYGVASPTTVYKSQRPYNHENGLARIVEVDAVLGHNRAASGGTLLRDIDSHPYSFDRWIAAHNGAFSPWQRDEKNDKLPQTDSFWAFKALHDSGADIYDDEHLAAWLSSYDDLTKAVLIFIDDWGATIVRHDVQRTLYYVKLPSGYMFHTSVVGLQQAVYVGHYYGVSIDEEYHVVPQRAVMRIPWNSTNMRVTSLEYTFKPYGVYGVNGRIVK